MATGDLDGVGRWFLKESNGKTKVRYEWIVKTEKSWMNLFAPLAYRLFKWNHDEVMKEGFYSLDKRLKINKV